MEIKDHFLQSDHCEFVESPNRGGSIKNGQPDTIVIHYTAGRSAENSVRYLCSPNARASAHLVVGRDGRVTQLVPFDTVAWHAGRSSHEGRTGLNKYAVGIEIDNAGRLTQGPGGFSAWFGGHYTGEQVVEGVHRNEAAPSFWHRYSEEQIETVVDLCHVLTDSYPIGHILGHEEVSPGRKTDPGPAFPLEKTRELVLQKDRSEEEEAEDWPILTTGVVTASRLNIRHAPNRDAPTVRDPLENGTVVEVRRESNGWYEIDVSTRGWVKKSYVRT